MRNRQQDEEQRIGFLQQATMEKTMETANIRDAEAKVSRWGDAAVGGR